MTRRFTNRRTTGSAKQERIFDAGPYLARVVSHLDNTFMGSLRVQLIKTTESGDYRDLDTSLITAHYASPFFGQTSVFSNGQNDDFQSTQQSYGFWAIPPDIDSKVLVTFIEGRRDICFWFACVPDEYMNFMVPDGRPSTVFTTPGTRPQEGRRYPVGEYNKRITNPNGNTQPTTYPKPVNSDFVNALTEQGLLEDDFRGLTSSSARREVPSAVFGINTPGPLDKRSSAPIAGRGDLESKANVPRARMTGHSIVMDDGDDKIVRVGSAADSPPEYVEIESAGSRGLPDDAVTRPANELFRIRTRTGHQILLHNTEDLIYIANARGTAWIELTSNGKIDIYAQDSISLHTEAEFNVTADSNINLTSGGNINLNASGNIQHTATNIDSTAGGRIALKAASEFSAQAGDFIALNSSADFGITSSAGEVNITGEAGVEINSPSDLNLISDGAAVRVAAGTNFEGVAGTMVAFQAPQVHDASDFRYINTSNLDIKSVGTLFTTNLLDILSTNIIIEGSGSIDIKSEGQIICTTDGTLKFKSGSTYELGSSNMSVNASAFQFTGIGKFASNLYTNKIWAPQAELNFIRSNSGSSGASAVNPTYDKHDPGDAAPATSATESEIPAPAQKTVGPSPTDPNPAPIAARVPQHEPWFEHENLNPQGYARVRADTETTETYLSPFPDTFLHIGRDQATVTQASFQTPTPSRAFGVGTDEEEDLIGTYDFNNYTDNASNIIAFFEGLGFEPWLGAGVAGALYWESGKNINPGAWLPPNSASDGLVNVSGNGGLGARGICQWRNSGNRLTKVEQFLGKPLLIQSEMNVNAPGYSNLRTERIPTQSYSSMPFDPGTSVRIAPTNTTLEDQLTAVYWEWQNDERATLRAIEAINSGSEVDRARQVAGIMNDVYLRSGNPVISGTRVKTRRQNTAQEIYEAHISGRPTGPITDPNEFPSPPVVGAGPEAGARPRTDGDTVDLSNSGNAANVINVVGANSRANPLRPEFISALNRAARDAGIHRINATSLTNEPLRRVNPASRIPIDRWGTLPDRTQGPGADMRFSGGKWERLINGRWQLRPNGASWRTGTERHCTGLAVDAYLQVNENGRYRTLNPQNSQADANKIAIFVEAFARYGGRAVGVGWSNAQYMKNGLYHYDMLGGAIVNNSQFVRPRGFTGEAVIGWNQQPSVWTYGSPPRDLVTQIRNALAAGIRGRGVA